MDTTNLIRPKVVMVDDDADLTTLIRSRLENAGCDMIATSTSEEFLDIIREQSADLCIVDLTIEAPGAGFTLIEKVRDHYGASLPIIVMSVESEPHSIAHALEIGADDYIVKPPSKTQFLEKCSKYIVVGVESFPARLHAVPDLDGSANLFLSTEIEGLDEYGVQIRSKDLIRKGSVVSLSCDLFEEIDGREQPLLLTVLSSFVDTKTRDFLSYLEFDLADEELLTSVRKWLQKAAKEPT